MLVSVLGEQQAGHVVEPWQEMNGAGPFGCQRAAQGGLRVRARQFDVVVALYDVQPHPSAYDGAKRCHHVRMRMQHAPEPRDGFLFGTA